MMKKLYSAPNAICIILAENDILTTSGPRDETIIGSDGVYFVDGSNL